MELEFNILGNSDSSKPWDITLEETVPELQGIGTTYITYNIVKFTMHALSDVNFINLNNTKTSLSLIIQFHAPGKSKENFIESNILKHIPIKNLQCKHIWNLNLTC